MTLTEAVFWAKRAGIILVVGFLLFIPLRLVFLILRSGDSGIQIEEEILYASQGYGYLSEISLTSYELAEESTPTFSLETTTGEFPEITTVAQVYQIPEKQQSLTELDDAKEFAQKLKFDVDPIRIPNTNKYQWIDDYGRVFTYDVSTQNFDIETDFEKDVYVLKSIIPDKDSAEKKARTFLESQKLLDETLEEGYTTSQFLKFSPTGEYLLADSQADADLVIVNFYRLTKLLQYTEEELALLEQYENNEIVLTEDQIPTETMTEVINEDMTKSNISIIIRGTNFNKVGEIYEMHYHYWPIDLEATETYYIKDPAEAWQEMKNGEAYLRYLVSNEGEPYRTYAPLNVSQFLVYDMSLVYLESEEYQTYLQPVYRISGTARTAGNSSTPDLDFVYIVPAITQY